MRHIDRDVAIGLGLVDPDEHVNLTDRLDCAVVVEAVVEPELFILSLTAIGCVKKRSQVA
jgi:hypothetical protein